MGTPDQAVRERALSLDASFIVQAPAGSGKTGLLTQRLLRLLSVVDQPEEILAITFTRKAAAEMRARVLKALHEADAPSAEEESDHARRTRALAQAACRRSEAQGWQLLADPSRLKIMTFDALNIRLAGTLPLTAGSAVTLQPVDDASALHRAAAREVLALAGEDDRDGDAVRLLLGHLDSDGQRFMDQLAAELARRDQWLRHVLAGTHDADHRSALEAALARMVTSRLVEAVSRLPARCVNELPVLMTQAAREATDAAVQACFAGLPDIAAGRLMQMPPASAEHVATWRAGAALLLTGKGELRKTMDKRCGFPPQAAQLKAQAVSLLDALSANTAGVVALQQIAALPDPSLEDSQWQLLEALGRVLTLASAALRLLGSERGETDFIELSLAAQRALGESTEPTDFALAMDFRLRHLLVDEFQDTSHGQFELLRRLVAGWTPGDGRTLFCVGDPMQSIYRFREADVGLFLQARRHGLGGVPLEPLHLTANFRSAPSLVTWVNALFAKLMPAEEDLATGAAPYTPAAAAVADDAGAEAEVSVLGSPEEETRSVVDWLRTALQTSDDTQSIAVLVRNRRHMRRILPALRDEGLPVEAIAFEPLADSPAVQDLIALTRALTHLDDRLAWLALLRSPCFGLSLAEIHALVYDAREQVVIEVLSDESRLARVAAGTRQRIVRGRGVLEHWLSRRGELRLAAVIEGCWLALGGPATLSDERDLHDCHALLRKIATLQRGCDLPDPAELPGQLAQLFRVHPSPARRCIQVMTIHHAKGLEFDHVVVCGLGEASRSDQRPLLTWQEIIDDDGSAALLLAPRPGRDGAGRALFEWLYAGERRRSELETDRLLYVATTRARRRLLVCGRAITRGDADLRLLAASPLARIHSVLGDAAATLPVGDDAPADAQSLTDNAAGTRWVEGSRRALPGEWLPPGPPSASQLLSELVVAQSAEDVLPFDWASREAACIGRVVHEWLQVLGEEGTQAWPESRLLDQQTSWDRRLRELGLGSGQAAACVPRVREALLAVLRDDTGRWLLAAHQHASSEWALDALLEGRLTRVVIDRSFIDEQGRRWIIDYKTGRHEGGDLEGFLASETRRYAEQLTTYGRVVSLLEPGRPQVLALYFPLLRTLRTLSADGAPEPAG